MPNFTIVTFKMWAYSPKIAKIGNFWYKFVPKGVYRLKRFLKIWLGDGIPGPHPHAKFRRSGVKKCGLTAPKIVKNGNFWHKFSPQVKIQEVPRKS